MITRTLSLCLLVFLATDTVSAQDDAYHVWLRDYLEQEYGLTGGSWTFTGNEAGTLSLATPSSGVTMDRFPPTGQQFTRAIKLTVPQPAPNPWERTVRFLIQQPVIEGDAMLLCVWLRHVWPADTQGLVETVFEIADEPYTKSLLTGYNIPDEWTLYLLPFENQVTSGAGQARFQLNMGREKQITDLGGLALINFGSTYAVNDLPTVSPPQTYSGRDPNASWRAPAQTRIEQIRMNDIEITVVGESGEPVENAEVHIRMNRHAFGFGTAVSAYQMTGAGMNQTYRDRLTDLTGDGRTFNISVLENALKWGPWEDNWPASKEEKGTIVAWLMSRGMDVRGHNLVWPAWQFLPADLESNQTDLEYITERIQNHIADIAGNPGLKGWLREWDVVNEPTHTTDLRDIYQGSPGYPTGEEIYADWFRWAEVADPDARLFVNEYSIVSAYGPSPNSTARPAYKRIIEDLLDAGVRLDGIGIQGHMSSPLTPIDTVYKALEEFAPYGLGLSITEYDAAGVDEDLAADYLRDFLTVTFSHPAVESFLMWGFWDGAHWFDDAPIFRQDWSLKPSGEAFIRLVFDEWWTDEVATTDPNGLVSRRGFLGDYTATVSHDGKTVSTNFTLIDSEPSTIEVSMAATGLENVGGNCDRNCGLQVQPNFPNPFRGRTALSITLSQASDLHLKVFDVTGRQVSTYEMNHAHPGTHSILLDLSDLPAGLYVYRLDTDVENHVGYLTHSGN